MAEGRQLPWKQQVIDRSRGPACSYSNLRRPLPRFPKGASWTRDEKTREWSIVGLPEATHPAAHPKHLNLNNIDGKIEGVDYVLHTIQPSDTFAGLCLKYRISAMKLRRANKFSGSNLRLAPATLVIPLEPKEQEQQQQPEQH